MISREDLERLAQLKSDHGILTAYIRLDPRLRFVRQQAASQFKRAVKAAQARLQNDRWQHALDRESSHVLKFLSTSEPAGQGLVIFSCRPESVWEFLPLEIPVPNFVDVDAITKTGILAQALDEVPRFVVAVLQRDKTRIYIAEQGTSEQQAQLATDVPGQHKQGGRSQMRFQRHIDFHVAEHLKKTAEEIERLTQAGTFDLLLGGTDEIITETLTVLSEPVAKRVRGRFPVDYKHDTEQQILERAERAWKDREQFEEANLVEEVVTAAKSHRRGVLGVEPTLSALVEEKVRTLLIANGVTIEGCVCTRCDYFSKGDFKICPLCGADTEHRDLTDRAVEKAILTGAEAEVVSSTEARARLVAEGGLAALLRY
jgi:peptide chain release factor subunit 1